MAFVRWSGVRPLTDALRRHCEAGKPLRVLTTTYTNSTEQRALDELERLGAQIKVSYDTSSTRLHAKAWIFHRESGYSTAYIGSSNLTHSAQVLGLGVERARLRGAESGCGREDGGGLHELLGEQGLCRSTIPRNSAGARSRRRGWQTSPCSARSSSSCAPSRRRCSSTSSSPATRATIATCIVAATGTGKTVMAAVDYARLRSELGRSRLLFVAHREEILDQSRATFRYALRDAAFGEKWVGGHRPERFEHVFASIQSLHSVDVRHIDRTHFDVVIVDEFHHAAAPSYEALLDHVQPIELLGLTATPERADGLDVLRHFDGRIAAELRLWDAIDQEYLAPFAYFGVHDGLDLRSVPWRRGQGYDVAALEGVLTADHAWAHLVVEEVRRKIADPSRMRALGYCVSVGHAHFMAQRFTELGLAAKALSATSRSDERRAALARTFGRNATSGFHGRPLQRGCRHPERRHAAPPPPDGQPDALPAATGPWAAEGGGEGRLHRP